MTRKRVPSQASQGFEVTAEIVPHSRLEGRTRYGKREYAFSVDKPEARVTPCLRRECRTGRIDPPGATMKVRSVGIVAVALGALVVARPVPSDAVGPDVSLKANTYSANLVQAMDECPSSVTNVGGVAACTS